MGIWGVSRASSTLGRQEGAPCTRTQPLQTAAHALQSYAWSCLGVNSKNMGVKRGTRSCWHGGCNICCCNSCAGGRGSLQQPAAGDARWCTQPAPGPATLAEPRPQGRSLLHATAAASCMGWMGSPVPGPHLPSSPKHREPSHCLHKHCS